MIIYQITNKVNQKIYVGKTTKSIEERFQRHLYSSKYGSPTYLHRAIRKYGVESFEISIVENVSDDINERERYWIKKLSPQYNMTEGGDGGDTSSSPNWIKNSGGFTKHDTYGMLGKKHPQKGKPLKKNYCPVMCEGTVFESVGQAQKCYKGISVRRRLDNPNHPEFYRLRPKTQRK